MLFALRSDDELLEVMQVVASDGTAREVGDFDASVLDERLAELYEMMVVTRQLDEEFVNLQRQGQLALFPSCRGQEAAQVGCATALRDDDWLFPQYRELGCFIARGIDPGGIGLMWRGAWHGGLGFVERAVAPMSIPIGTQALHAVGAAMAATRLGDGGVTVAFLGDGATSEGDVHEAMNLAAVEAAPCLFYVQNNGWAISVPLAEQLKAPSIAHKAIGYGMPAIRVDGNDVVACHLAVQAAAEHARRGGGPTLIEAVTYRMGPHTTSDDPTRYRTEDQVAEWRALDPIDRLVPYMQARGVWHDDVATVAIARATELRTRLRGAVVDAPDPAVTEMFDHVFATPTPDLVAQKASLVAELEVGAR